MLARILTTLILILLIASGSWAAHLHKEKYYQQIWCNEQGGMMEVVLQDRTRVDCLTDEFAVVGQFEINRGCHA